MCRLCGQPNCFNPDNCISAQPFCDNCAEDTRCTSKTDAQCVIYHFNTDEPSRLINLGLPNKTNLEVILETIDSLIGNHFNVPFTPQDTITVKWVAGGTAGHSPKANVIISPSTGNTLVSLDNGLFAPSFNKDYKVKVNADDIPDYLVNQIGGDTDGIVSISTTVESGLLKILPSINLLCLINALRTQYQAEFCDLVDSCKCLLNIENLMAILAPACPTGYTLNGSATFCQKDETVAPTTGVTTVEVCVTRSNSWNGYGALVYKTGYLTDGRGPAGSTTNDIDTDLGATNVVQINTTNVWQNVAHNGSGTPTDLDGPLNRAGIWACDGGGSPDPSFVGTLGFTVPVNVVATKVYYIGISGDNDVSIAVTSPGGSPTSLVATRSLGTSAYENYYGNGSGFIGQGPFMPFRTWNIYEVTLQAGINYITLSCTNNSGPGGFAAEIYNNTLAELQAAALDPTFVSSPNAFPLNQNPYSNLDLVFSTRCARQPNTTFAVGSATCPDSTWTLDTSGGNPLVEPCQGINGDITSWVCRRTLSVPFSGYTVTLVWDRIPNAIDYTVEQKLHSDPDTAYVASSGSPVANPGSGTTVTLTVSGLSSNDMDFRIRTNFESCSTAWTVIES